MASFSRWLARLDAVRTAVYGLALCVLLGLLAYAVASYYTTPTPGALAAAVAALLIAGAALVYAWRPGPAGLGD